MNREYITVTNLNNYIKSLLEKDGFLTYVLLKGEISNLKKHPTGHWYFTLKDETSKINAVMFAKDNQNVLFNPEDGMNVLIICRVSAYPTQGSYQVYVSKLELDGIGNLYIEYEKLKKKLAEEGLFSLEKKKNIPKYPEKIGIITASTGAAVKDIISTIKRRNRSVEIILFPTLVQGKDAAPNIVNQIIKADNYNLDTIILGRGGGSIEDLWAFNEEIVARAIYEANTPIISAVGHEIDFTIADYVADLRAPTPTGAAEMAVPTVIDTLNIINHFKIRLNKNIKNMINTKFIKLRSVKSNYLLKNPLTMYEIKMQKLDTLILNGEKNIKGIIEIQKNRLDKIKLSHILKTPQIMIDNFQNQINIILANLKNLNPLEILEKGYSVVKVKDKIIKSSKEVKIKDLLEIKFKKGSVTALVKEIKNGN